MPTIMTAKHLEVFSRDPRALFFANRALAHAQGMTSFDEINKPHKAELTISAHLALQATSRLALHQQK